MAILPDISTVSNISSYITPSTTDLSKILLNLKSYLDENTAVTNSLINKFTVSKKGNVSPATNLKCGIDKKGVHWSWDASKDTNIVLYELRFDSQVGIDNGPYKQVTNLQCDCTPINRVGTAYLYAYNAFGEYGDPATFSYVKATPSAPTNVNVDSLFQSVKVSFDPIPDDCICATVYLNDSSVVTDNNLVTISDAIGIWDIQVCYVDVFGEGIKSAVIQAGVLPQIDEALIKAEALSLNSMNTTIKDAVAKAQISLDTTTFEAHLTELNKDPYSTNPPIYNSISQLKIKTDEISTTVSNKANASDLTQTANSLTATIGAINTNLNKQPGESPYTSISQLKLTCDNLSSTITSSSSNLQSQITQSAGNINSVITELGKSYDACSYTAISQAYNDIQLRAKSANMISLINVCPETITIASKFLHITGDTLFDDNVIVERMLYAGSVTSGKIAAGAVTADKISAGSVTADKINVGSLDAICATIGTLRTATTGARTEIKDNLIQVFDSSGTLRVRMGVW